MGSVGSMGCRGVTGSVGIARGKAGLGVAPGGAVNVSKAHFLSHFFLCLDLRLPGTPGGFSMWQGEPKHKAEQSPPPSGSQRRVFGAAGQKVLRLLGNAEGCSWISGFG